MTYAEASAVLGAMTTGIATAYFFLRSWALIKGLVLSWIS
jgi:hypothetical protein